MRTTTKRLLLLTLTLAALAAACSDPVSLQARPQPGVVDSPLVAVHALSR